MGEMTLIAGAENVVMHSCGKFRMARRVPVELLVVESHPAEWRRTYVAFRPRCCSGTSEARF